jgi:hypothetical protein
MEKMIPMNWSERRLPFGKGPIDIPFLLERMQGTPIRVAALFREHPVERLVLGANGKWSPLEGLAHLLHLDQRMQARVDDFEARRPALCRIDLEDQHMRIAAHRGQSPGDMIEEFKLTRALLVRRLRQLDGFALQHRATHPCMAIAYGPADMALWLAEHDDHHLLSMRLQLSGSEV